MAGVLETASLTVPRASPPITSSSVSVLSGRRRSVKLPSVQFRDLKLHYFTLSSSSATALSSGTGHRRGRLIVCEAQQDTAVDVPSVTEKTWQSLVLESNSPVLVEFWAPWCGPCRMIHPVIDKLAKQYTGKLKCFKLNTDESPSIASQYAIRSIPTVIIFKNGEKKDAVIGAVPESTLTTSIDKFL